MTSHLQQDQQPPLWSRFAEAYEAAFEPLTDVFADAALQALELRSGELCLDVAAGTGGAALMAAARGARVVAIDAAEGMVARIRERGKEAGLPVRAAVMDAQALALSDASCDAGLSVFGIILCPDPVRALEEMGRVVRPGRPLAIVTWTEPQNYDLVTRLISAVTAVRGPQAPPTQGPAQLRFREEAALQALFKSARVPLDRIVRIEADLRARSAEWLAEHLAFAPGLAAMLDAQGPDRKAVVARFADDLRRDQGDGPVALGAVGFLAVGQVPE
ncbi:class I SAM-dependent methyltransferase [Methylobacterium brachiatum]